MEEAVDNVNMAVIESAYPGRDQLTMAQAAGLFGMRPEAFRQSVREHPDELPFERKDGGLYFISKKDLVDYFCKMYH